ncbi:Rhomboid protein [Paramyrothecium foliicola]|nr:Rhomboid protein [Paramyrothecium foliicola]
MDDAKIYLEIRISFHKIYQQLEDHAPNTERHLLTNGRTSASARSVTMSLFLCPHASRSLLRAVVQGSSASAPRRWNSTASMQWLSCSAGARARATGSRNYQESWVTSRLQTSPGLYTQRRSFFGPKVIRDYQELPKDYRDQAGLPFSPKELSETEAAQLFGTALNAKAANHLLRVLHGRRVAGTLDDPAFAIHTAQYSKDQMGKALEFLRRKVPVEEVLNAGLRAEDELAQMEQEMEQAAKKQQKTNDVDDIVETPEYKEDPVYGRSNLDEIRARNVARRKAKEKLQEEERKAREAAEGGPAGPLARREDQTREIANPRIAEYYKAAQSDLAEPPQLRTWERILPSATVVALVLGFLAAVATVYEEPAPRYRLIPEVTPAQATVGVIIGINAMVFLAWRVPPLWKLLNRTMIFVVATPKPLTLFTSVFSHSRLSHLITNMVPLWFVGTGLHDELGRAQFLALFLGCGATGFLGSLVAYTLRGWLTVTSLGASGATLGLLSAYFWEHRNDGFRFGGLPDTGVHGIIFLALIMALQLTAFGKTARLKVDIASHMSGIAAGILGIELIGRGRKNESERPQGERDSQQKAIINLIGGPAATPVEVGSQSGGRSLPT